MRCQMSKAEAVMRKCDIHSTRSIKSNSAVNLSPKLGWTFAVTRRNIYREYYVPAEKN